jgi:diacylglycerol kinase family enzyme
VNPPPSPASALRFDPGARWRFVVNAGSGAEAAQARCDAISQALQAAGRTGDILLVEPAELPTVAVQAARAAALEGGAVVAAGGDGTINTVANAAHAQGCALGVLAHGTFNYFARAHGLGGADAAAALLGWQPQPVAVGCINERIFLVNASLGLHAQMLADREAWKARLGRHRAVAVLAAAATLLARHRLLRLQVQVGGRAQQVGTPVLFVGNNRLQFEQLGLDGDTHDRDADGDARLVGVVLKPVGPLGLVGLALRGAFGTLGDAGTVDRFAFDRMTVAPRWPVGRRGMRVAVDGEVMRLRPPLAFALAAQPLFVLKPP